MLQVRELNMSTTSDLHAEIMALVNRYYEEAFARPADFVPQQTQVNYAGRVFDAKELTNLVDSALCFWLTAGKYTAEFEAAFAEYLGVKKALLVNSGSSANLLAFMTLTSPLLRERMIRPGDEVITVAACFPTTVAPIIQYGAIPVFVDIDRETLNVDTSRLEAALSPRTKCVFLAHTLGNPFNIAYVRDFCTRHNLWLIEDNCDALGSLYQGRKTGTFGDIGTSSFYPAHHITTGEGGAVYTSDKLLHRIMLSLRDWGRDCWCAPGADNTCKHRFSKQFGQLPEGYDHKYVYSHFGYNLKATDMQAAVGCAQLAKLPEFVAARRSNFDYLAGALEEVRDHVHFIKPEPGSEPSWFGFGLSVKDDSPFTRNDLAEFLESRKIQTRNLFSGNILKHPCVDHLTEGKEYRVVGGLPNTDFVMNNTLWIGVYPGMDAPRLDYMAQQIKAFIKRFGREA
ncbi:lipopolysaccharide biosynthesis protein RfbH [Pseudodesulfovibrio indicus]